MSRNVETLTALIAEHLPGREAAPWWIDRCRTLAERLAARGVLAVDSLTDEQCGNLVWTQSIHEDPKLLRAALFGVARGES